MGVSAVGVWLYVCFHACSALAMGTAVAVGLLALCQAYVLQARLNLVMQAYRRLVVLECLVATVFAFTSIAALADRSLLYQRDPGWCVASSFVLYVLFMGQAAGVMLVSKATLTIVRSHNEEAILGCKQPWRFVTVALLLGTTLAAWLLMRRELGGAADLLCVTTGHGEAATVHWAATTGVTTAMTVTASTVMYNCWSGVRDMKRLTRAGRAATLPFNLRDVSTGPTQSSSEASVNVGQWQDSPTSSTPNVNNMGASPSPSVPNIGQGVVASPRQAALAVRTLITFISEVLSVLLTHLVSGGALLAVVLGSPAALSLVGTDHNHGARHTLFILLGAILGLCMRLEPFMNAMIFYSAMRRLRTRNTRVGNVLGRAKLLEVESSRVPSALLSLTGGDSGDFGGGSTGAGGGGVMRSVNEEEDEEMDAEDIPLSDLATEALTGYSGRARSPPHERPDESGPSSSSPSPPPLSSKTKRGSRKSRRRASPHASDPEVSLTPSLLPSMTLEALLRNPVTQIQRIRAHWEQPLAPSLDRLTEGSERSSLSQSSLALNPIAGLSLSHNGSFSSSLSHANTPFSSTQPGPPHSGGLRSSWDPSGGLSDSWRRAIGGSSSTDSSHRGSYNSSYNSSTGSSNNSLSNSNDASFGRGNSHSNHSNHNSNSNSNSNSPPHPGRLVLAPLQPFLGASSSHSDDRGGGLDASLQATLTP